MKFKRFYEVLSYIKELAESQLHERGSLEYAYFDLSVWNEYVTVDFAFENYVMVTEKSVRVVDSLFEVERTINLVSAYAVSRVRGGYKVEELVI